MKNLKEKDLLNVINIYQNYMNDFINITDKDLSTLLYTINARGGLADDTEVTPVHEEQCWNCKEDIKYTDLHAFCPECLTSV